MLYIRTFLSQGRPFFVQKSAPVITDRSALWLLTITSEPVDYLFFQYLSRAF